MAYRYWCGECGFKTAWGTGAEGEQQQIEHYRKQHPGLVPGGQVEVNRLRPGGRRGCLLLLALLVLLPVLAAACRH